MKTKNNVQKAILRSAAVIISFILLSFTVTAQGFWKHLLANTSFNQIAAALVENTTANNHSDMAGNSTTDAERPFVLYEETEESLELKPWMTEINFWAAGFSIEDAKETNLEVEDWMVNNHFFEVAEKAVEPSIKIEPWMTSGNLWDF